MKFRTVVDTSFPEIRIAPEDEMTLLGSCFADHIGRRMCRAGFDVNVNPFGVLYNPQSIATVCTFAASGKSIPEDCFFEADGLWHNWLNDSSFSAESREACRARWETVCREERERLCTLRFLFITLGTNRCYVLKENGRVVGNCHKQPACRFTERQMGVEDTAEVLGEMLHELWP
ncbi:MAG: GSCFA domain-containing protein, partial [Paraprevotella sp.]|nr:GSCFA domain-containing protein [Paraprevotella sp.]